MIPELRPRPVQAKPISEMTLAEWNAFSSDLERWLDEKRDHDVDVALAGSNPPEQRRVDPMNRPVPMLPPRKRGERPGWSGATPEYLAQKKRESRARLRGEAL